MVSKKGWVRIIEATMCAILIIAVVLIYAQDNNSYFNVEDYADIESAIDELILQPDIRVAILNDTTNVEEIVNFELMQRIKRSSIRVNSTVCSFNEVDSPSCTIPRPTEIKNVHAYERLVSTNRDGTVYSPSQTKVIRIVVFEDR